MAIQLKSFNYGRIDKLEELRQRLSEIPAKDGGADGGGEGVPLDSISLLNGSIERLDRCIGSAPGDQGFAWIITAIGAASIGLGILGFTGIISGVLGCSFLISGGLVWAISSAGMRREHEISYGFGDEPPFKALVLSLFGNVAYLYSVYSMPSRLQKKIEQSADDLLKRLP